MLGIVVSIMLGGVLNYIALVWVADAIKDVASQKDRDTSQRGVE